MIVRLKLICLFSNLIPIECIWIFLLQASDPSADLKPSVSTLLFIEKYIKSVSEPWGSDYVSR